MPNPRILNRKLHRWGAIATALPFLLVIITGLLLQLKKQLPWVQPPEQRTPNTVPSLSMEQILRAANRRRSTTGDRRILNGFRLARTPGG